MRRLSFSLVLVALGHVALVEACVSNPSIDGSTVPKIGSAGAPASCFDLCARLERLCGYPPLDCEPGCEEEFDEEQRACIGQASSCQAALEDCAPPEDDTGGEGGANEAGDGGTDGD